MHEKRATYIDEQKIDLFTFVFVKQNPPNKKKMENTEKSLFRR